MEQEPTDRVEDWQSLVNKPVYASDGKDIGIVSQIQPLHLIVTFGVIIPDKFNIPKTSIKNIHGGVVHLKEDSKIVKDTYAFE